MQVNRLTDLFTPENYQLSLNIQRPERKFDGVVVITGTSLKDGEIRLHAKELSIESIIVNDETAKFSTDDNDELVITCASLHANEPAIIKVQFGGDITDGMHGIYPCYFEHGGIKKELIATQFESHHAREVFPCIDEPAAKATFDVTLTTETGVDVLGNMPIIKQTEKDSRQETTFDTTPRMSSYLLAWVVGELQKVSGKTKRGVEVNIWATPAQPAESLDFARDIATRCIDFYESYFDTEYPLPKSDHVALPDFSAGAMENWGLITYREIALLANPATTSISAKQYIATVIAHELAHQWFGNLVTMKWWNDLWLNESFASLMEYLAVDALQPNWNMWTQFSTNESIYALRRDAIDGVQSVQIDVNHPDEINSIFDGAIVYAKGARLLRMLQTYVGDEAFQAGLKYYFSENAYRNTEAVDLWNAIDKASPKNGLAELMNTWLSQPGYPVITADKVGDKIKLTQEQFFTSPHQPSDRLWPIPLGVDGLPDLMTKKTIEIEHTNDLLLNPKDSAHFITNYDDFLLSNNLNKVKDGSLPIINRLQLLHEATLLARGGVIPSERIIDIIQSYISETSEPVWDILSIALSELRRFVEDDVDAETQLRRLSAELARPLYQRLGWEMKLNESEDDTKLRATVISLMLYGEDEAARAKAKDIYENTPIDNIDPELRPIILSSVVRNGEDKIVDDLLSIYNSTQSSEIQNDIVFGITSSKSTTKIGQLLENIKQVRAQDVGRWFAYLVRGRYSRQLAWDWMRQEWKWIVDTFGGDKSYDNFPTYAGQALKNRKQLEEFRSFFNDKKDIPALSRAIAMGATEIEGRVELIERDGPGVCAKLKQLK